MARMVDGLLDPANCLFAGPRWHIEVPESTEGLQLLARMEKVLRHSVDLALCSMPPVDIMRDIDPVVINLEVRDAQP